MAERINSIMKALLAAAVLAVCCAAPPARAQIGTILEPLPSPEQVTFSEVELAQITAYMTKRVDAIIDGETKDRERARGEILTPLRRAGVSVAFRRAVSSAVIDRLSTAADSSAEDVVINVLFVLAEVADDATRQVVQQHTDDESQSVRYAAVGAMRRTFRVVETFAPAIDPTRVGEMVGHLEDRLKAEQDPQVSLAITRALLQAGQIRRDGFDGASGRALTAVSSGVGAPLRQADDAARPIAMLGCAFVGEDLTSRLQTPGSTRPEFARSAAGYGGEMLAWLIFKAGKGEVPAERKAEVDLARLAERCVAFASIKLGGSPGEPGLASLLEQGKDQEFFDQGRRFVLSLSGSPWSLPASDMKRIQDALDGK